MIFVLLKIILLSVLCEWTK